MKDTPLSYAVPMAIEMLGVTVVAIGIGIEMVMRADVGYSLISVGSILITAGGLIWTKVFKYRKDLEKEKKEVDAKG